METMEQEADGDEDGANSGSVVAQMQVSTASRQLANN